MPVYNEGFLLDEMLTKILQTDAGLLDKMLVIDDASTDSITPGVLAKWRAKGLDVLSVTPKEKKSPKRDAIIKAIQYLRQTDQMPAKLIFTDGDTFFKAQESYGILGEALESAIENKDQRCLTAISFPIVPIQKNFLTYLGELEFVLERTQRKLLDYVGINPVLSGGASIIDGSVYESLMNDLIEGHDLADDMHITLLLQKEGYRTGYAPDFVLAFSDMPENLSDLIKQRTRWFIAYFRSLFKERRAIFAQAFQLKIWAVYRIVAIVVLLWPSALLALAGIIGLVPFSEEAIAIQFTAWGILITSIFLITPERLQQQNRFKMLLHLPLLIAYQYLYIPIVQMLGIAGLLGVNVNKLVDRCSSLWSSFISVVTFSRLLTPKIDFLFKIRQFFSENILKQETSLKFEPSFAEDLQINQVNMDTLPESLSKQFVKHFRSLFMLIIFVFFTCSEFVSPTAPQKAPSRLKENSEIVEFKAKFIPKLDRLNNPGCDSSRTIQNTVCWMACSEAAPDYAVAYVDFLQDMNLTGGIELLIYVRNTIPGIQYQVQLLPNRDRPGSAVGLSPVIRTLPEGNSLIRIHLTEFNIDISHIERLTIHHGRKNVVNQVLNTFTHTSTSSFLADNPNTRASLDICSIELVQTDGFKILLTPDHLKQNFEIGDVKFWYTLAFIVISILLFLLYLFRNFIFKQRRKPKKIRR